MIHEEYIHICTQPSGAIIKSIPQLKNFKAVLPAHKKSKIKLKEINYRTKFFWLPLYHMQQMQKKMTQKLYRNPTHMLQSTYFNQKILCTWYHP